MRDETVIGIEERALDDAALEALADAHASPPPPGLRARILGEAERDTAVRDSRRAFQRWRIVGVVAAALALALTTLLARSTRLAAERGAQLEALVRSNAVLTARIDEQDRALGGLRQSVAAQAQALGVLGAPRTRTALLAPSGSGTASGRVLVDPISGNGALLLSGLPPAAAGKTYELWTIRGDRPPEPSGLFAAGGDTVVIAPVQRIAHSEEVTAFALSIEPAAGSAAPTEPIVLAGAVAG
jgi:anti-sigma-K factor RskA